MYSKDLKELFLGTNIEITQTKYNNLDNLINLTLGALIICLFFSLKSGNDDPAKKSFDKY